VKVGWIGRGGRSPLAVADAAARGVLLLNGTAPVKTFVQMNEVLQMSILNLRRTSITTIANEKTSASLLNVPRLSKISGAIHRVLCPYSSGAPRIESRFWVTMARPQSMIIAWPVASTRMFGWSVDVNMSVVTRSRTIAYPPEISVNDITGVQVIDAFRDVG